MPKPITLIPLPDQEPAKKRPKDRWRIIQVRDAGAEQDSVWIRFPLKGTTATKSHLVPVSLLSAPSKLIDQLRDKGADLPKSKKEALSLIKREIGKLPDEVGVHLKRTGWYSSAFRLKRKVVNRKKRVIYLDGEVARRSPTLPTTPKSPRIWGQQVGLTALKSSSASFAIMLSLAAPLVRFAGFTEGAIFNFAARGSSGKTTAMKVGASVHSSPAKMPDWNETPRGLVETAAAHSDMALMLDDVERLRYTGSRLDHLSSLTHILTSGSSTEYASMVRDKLPTLNWTCWILSSSPKPIEIMFSEGRKPRTAGDQVRWIDMVVPDESAGGMWDLGEPDGNRGESTEALEGSAQANHGALIVPWLKFLCSERRRLRSRIKKELTRISITLAPDATGVTRRIARKFALIQLAGEWAIEQGLLPWPREFPAAVVSKMFTSAMAINGETQRWIDETLRRLVAAFNDPDQFPIIERGAKNQLRSEREIGMGFRERGPSGDWIHFRLKSLEAFVGGPGRAKTVISYLEAINALEKDNKGKNTPELRINVAGKDDRINFLKINPDLLG